MRNISGRIAKTTRRVGLLAIFLAATALAQGARSNLQEGNGPPVEPAFARVEEGLANGDADRLSPLLGSQTYLSLFDGSQGYYSSGQAFYLLQDFFRVNRPVSFKFVNKHDGDAPYATGEYQYETRGRRNVARVYAAFKRDGSSWKLSQLSIQ